MSNPEKWREVPGYPRYEVSFTGRIRGRNYGKELNTTPRENGRRYARLRKSDAHGRIDTFSVPLARLVFTAFRHKQSEEEKSKHIRHADGDPSNCALDNLVLVSDPDGFVTTPLKQRKPNWRLRSREKDLPPAVAPPSKYTKLSKKDREAVYSMYRPNGMRGRYTQSQLAKMFDVSVATINNIVNPKIFK